MMGFLQDGLEQIWEAFGCAGIASGQQFFQLSHVQYTQYRILLHVT
jgi:hypothetical protein